VRCYAVVPAATAPGSRARNSHSLFGQANHGPSLEEFLDEIGLRNPDISPESAYARK